MLRGGAAFLHNCLTDCQRTDDLADGVVSSRPKYFPKWLSHGRYYLLIFRERVTQFSTLALTRVGRWCRLQSFRREWFSTPLDTNVTFLFSSFSNFFFPYRRTVDPVRERESRHGDSDPSADQHLHPVHTEPVEQLHPAPPHHPHRVHLRRQRFLGAAGKQTITASIYLWPGLAAFTNCPSLE